MTKSKIQKKKFRDICKNLSSLKNDVLLLVIDQKVAKIFGKKIIIPHKQVFTWVAPQGEKCKNFASYQRCSEYFLKKGIHRNAHLIAIGGGATSDLAGYVASTLLRGISWSVIPTTLLAMVDASIGGKTAINVGTIKNQLGTFHLPENIWFDFSFLKTLSSKEILSGKGEILKYTFLSQEIAEILDRKGFCPELIMACANFKNNLVSKDPHELKNIRAKLNLGHTLGHAYEQMWEVPHGFAVAYGVRDILSLYDCFEDLPLWQKRIFKLGFNLKLDKFQKKQTKEIMKYIRHDKKKLSHDTIQVIVPSRKKVFIRKITLCDFEKKLNNLYGC